MKYIQSIDGLRAIAVIIVLLFHVNMNLCQGGFIGVDVFFVISGFLITSNIILQKENNTFSFGKFYKKRIARLFPSLFTIILITLLSAYFFLPPTELQRLGQVSINSTISISNIFFWLEAGYFDRLSEVKPLLHTWSLSVEEQFYLIWPSLIVLLYSLRKKIGLILGLTVLSLLSLFFALKIYPHNPNSVFFLTPYRIYQFGIGALISITGYYEYKPYKNIFGLISIIGIGSLTVLVDGSSHLFYTAILPAVFGGCFIISSQTKLMNSIFASWPFVWIGKRSYSIYLVHWPLIVLWKISTDMEFSELEKYTAIIASLVLGHLLHTSVEKRFRYRASFSQNYKNNIIISVLVLSLINMVIAAHYWGNDGIPHRFQKMQQYSELEDKWNERIKELRMGRCNLQIGKNKSSDFDEEICLNISAQKRNWLVFGDSYASGSYLIFKNEYPDINFLQATFPGCKIQTPSRLKGNEMCDQVQAKVYNFIESNDELEGVIISANWKKGHIYIPMEISNFIRENQKKVIVLSQRIKFKDRVPTLVVSTKTHDAAVSKCNEMLKNENFEINRNLEEQLSGKFTVIDMIKLQCPDGLCDIFDSQKNLLYLDDSHFTMEGVEFIGQRLTEEYGYILN